MVYSADGIPGSEALATQKILTVLLSYKLKQEYSEMCGFVQERMSLAIVRSNSLLLRGPREKRGTNFGGDGTARALSRLKLGAHDGKYKKG